MCVPFDAIRTTNDTKLDSGEIWNICMEISQLLLCKKRWQLAKRKITPLLCFKSLMADEDC